MAKVNLSALQQAKLFDLRQEEKSGVDPENVSRRPVTNANRWNRTMAALQSRGFVASERYDPQHTMFARWRWVTTLEGRAHLGEKA